MPHHRAYGLPLDQLDVIIVDDAKPMQQILRSILLNVHVARVRAFDRPEEALQAMMVEPPSLLITDWHMKPTDGLALLRTMRRKRMGAVALVPAILVTAHPTRQLVESALAAGAHSVIAKPVAPATLITRINAILNDQRQFVVDDEETMYFIEGHEKLIAAERERWQQMMGSRAAHAARLKAAQAAAAAKEAAAVAAADKEAEAARLAKEAEAARLAKKVPGMAAPDEDEISAAGRRRLPLGPKATGFASVRHTPAPAGQSPAKGA